MDARDINDAIMALRRLWDEEGAEAAYAANLKHGEPGIAPMKILAMRAELLWDMQRKDEAGEIYSFVLQHHPRALHAVSRLASIARERGKPEEAVALLEGQIQYGADKQPAFILDLAKAYDDAARVDEAEATMRQLHRLVSPTPETHYNLALILGRAGKPLEAIEEYQAALALRPSFPEALCNLSTPLREIGRFREAMDAAAKAIEQRPDYPNAHQNLGQAAFLSGDLETGWREHAWRWRNERTADRVGRRDFPQPALQRAPQAGDSLLVWGEEAIGEEILYASFYPELLERGVKLFLECDPRLLPLYRRSFPGAEVFARRDPPDGALLADDISFQAAAGDLGQWLRPDFESFPERHSFLRADRGKTQSLREKYRALGEGPVVGLSWRSKNQRIGYRKSSQIAEWLPILRTPGVTFVNLQYGDCREELAALQREHGITVHQDESVDQLASLDDLAAQVSAMDLVLSVSNSAVHFAGALGIPCWALIPAGRAAYWFWFADRRDSPWYPSLTLYRQAGARDWQPLLNQVAGDFADWRQAWTKPE